MTRGRSIDKTIPPSRALAQQRDYRARKAAKIDSLEEEVAQLRLENNELRQQLREVQSGNSDGDNQISRSVVDIRQHLLRALDIVNIIDGDTISYRPNSVGHNGLGLSLSTRNLHQDSGQEGNRISTAGAGAEGIARPNLACLVPESPTSPSLSTTLHAPYATSVIPHPINLSSVPISLVNDSKCCIRLKEGRDQSTDLRHITTSPVHPQLSIPVPVKAMEMEYDDECCGGIFDCSHIPLMDEGMHEANEVDQRVISNCRGER